MCFSLPNLSHMHLPGSCLTLLGTAEGGEFLDGSRQSRASFALSRSDTTGLQRTRFGSTKQKRL